MAVFETDHFLNAKTGGAQNRVFRHLRCQLHFCSMTRACCQWQVFSGSLVLLLCIVENKPTAELTNYSTFCTDPTNRSRKDGPPYFYLPEVYEVIPKWFYPHVQNSEGGAPWQLLGRRVAAELVLVLKRLREHRRTLTAVPVSSAESAHSTQPFPGFCEFSNYFCNILYLFLLLLFPPTHP